jgi:hypothetical protein
MVRGEFDWPDTIPNVFVLLMFAAGLLNTIQLVRLKNFSTKPH